MPELRQFQVSDDHDRIFDALLSDGVVIVHNFITGAQIRRLNTELDPYIACADPLMRNVYDFFRQEAPDDPATGRVQTRFVASDAVESFVTGNTRNVTRLAARASTFTHEILDHPLYMAMCERFLRLHCKNYILNHGHLINVGPGAKAQPLHRDEAIWDSMPGLGVGSHLQFASIVALVDFTKANGATRIVPGSHLWDGDPRGLHGRVPTPQEVCHAMPAGSVVLYTGWTFHGAGQNRTRDVFRRGLHVSYCQGWLRTEGNNVLAAPPSVVRNLDAKKQELLGYGVHGVLGMLELRSPIQQMRDGAL